MPIIYSFLFFGTIFFSHWLIYRFCIKLFKVTKKLSLNTLRAVFIFLPLSFVIAMFVSHRWDNIATRAFYFCSGIWYGVFINLLLATCIYYFIIIIARLFKINFKNFILANFLFVAAILVSIFGILNVLYPGVKEIEINIKDLPNEWEGKTIVQLSDVHLGKVLGVDYLNRVIAKTNALNPDVILLTGDLFDGMDGSLERFVSPLSTLKANEGVFYVNGNHEIYLGVDEAFSIIKKTNIKALQDEVVDINGLQFIGVSYPERNSGNDIEKIISENKIFDNNKPSILLFHSPTSIDQKNNFDHRELYFSPSVDFQTAINLGADLQLSGHTHNGQLFPFNYLTHFVYAGYDYGLHKIGDFQIYIASGVGVWGPTMRTSGWSEIVKIILRSEEKR